MGEGASGKSGPVGKERHGSLQHSIPALGIGSCLLYFVN